MWFLAYAALLPVKTVGVMGDNRTYEQAIALRAVETTDFMTADWYPMPYEVLKKISGRIINEFLGHKSEPLQQMCGLRELKAKLQHTSPRNGTKIRTLLAEHTQLWKTTCAH